ncbi:glycosyltransferase family 2 protein [Castellaniella sp.]|uniref:glycosyltransferase family 2 protein n=1 Tax=Castellaniella sp. TaxID=1955812 RepID=UPI003561D611
MSLAGASSRLPLVSIVMPAWNAQATLAEAIASVQAQTLADWELLVVVDAATDDTLAIAQAHAESDARVGVLVNPVNRGVAETRNRALAEARGEYVAFLDSDDRWHADKLAQQCASLQATGCAISYTAYQRFGAEGVLNRVTPVLRVTFHDLLRGNVIGLSTGMLRAGLARELRFASIGHEDYLFWLQAVQRAGEARRVPSEQPLADYRVQAGSRSANIWRNAGWQWHIYRHHLGLSWPTAAGLMGHYAARAWAKRRAS